MPRKTETRRDAYRHVADQSESVVSLRRGFAQAKKGLGRPVDEVFDKLSKESLEAGRAIEENP